MTLQDSVEWNILKRDQYTIQPVQQWQTKSREYLDYLPIKDIAVLANSPIIMVGISSKSAKKHWYLGGWAAMYLNIVPGSNTDFVAAVKTDPQKCKLNNLTLIRFPFLGIYPYTLVVSIPYYFEDVYIEIWEYTDFDKQQTFTLEMLS